MHFSHLSAGRAVFHFFSPHSSPVAAFCPFLNVFFPEALPKGSAMPCCGAALEPSGAQRAAPLLRQAPIADASPHTRRCEGSASAALFCTGLAKDVFWEPSFSFRPPCFKSLVPGTHARPPCGGQGARSPEVAAWLYRREVFAHPSCEGQSSD